MHNLPRGGGDQNLLLVDIIIVTIVTIIEICEVIRLMQKRYLLLTTFICTISQLDHSLVAYIDGVSLFIIIRDTTVLHYFTFNPNITTNATDVGAPLLLLLYLFLLPLLLLVKIISLLLPHHHHQPHHNNKNTAAAAAKTISNIQNTV